MSSRSGSSRLFVAFAVVFAALAAVRLSGLVPFDAGQVAVMALLSVGSALLAWSRRGAPRWAGRAGQGAYAVAIALALALVVAETV